MKLKSVLIFIFTFIIVGCSANTSNAKITQEDQDIVESSQDILNALKKEHFPALFPNSEITGKNGLKLNKEETRVIFVDYWTSYFVHYYVLLKTNFDYDKSVRDGIYQEDDLTVTISHENISVPQSARFYYNSCQLKMTEHQQKPYYKQLLYGCVYRSLYFGMEKEIYQLSLRNIKPDSKYIIGIIERRGNEAFESYYKRYMEYN